MALRYERHASTPNSSRSPTLARGVSFASNERPKPTGRAYRSSTDLRKRGGERVNPVFELSVTGPIPD